MPTKKRIVGILEDAPVVHQNHRPGKKREERRIHESNVLQT